MRLQGKVAIVTGAASGFGAEIARQYVKEGAKVALADINEAGAKDVAGPLGPQALAVKCDVTQRADIDALVAATLKAFGGRLDIVVNNAGWSHKNGPLLDVDEATFDKLYAINVKSIFHMIHAVVPILRKQRSGVILNVGSTAGIRPRPGLTWYNSSKGAVNLMSKSLAVELGARQHPRQRDLPGDGRHRPARAVHGHARHAGEPQEVHRHHPAGAPVDAAGHRACRGLSGQRRRGVHHRRGVSGRRRTHGVAWRVPRGEAHVPE